MALDSAELISFARDAASRGEDLYALLNVDATTPKEDIHRAWRKAGLKYHPDKAGANYDPVKYESFERARDVLVDPAAREAYDNGLRAKLEKKRKMDEMSSERRRFVEELERAEREAKRTKREAEEGLGAEERKRAAEAGRRRMEERARQIREAEERSKARERSREKSPVVPVPVPVATGTPRPAAEPMKPTSTTETNGTAPSVPSKSKDEYDEREAELMRKLAEKQARKAAKKSRKSDISGLSSSKRWEGDAETPIKPQPTPPCQSTAESKADGDKGPLPPHSRPSFLKEYAASAPTSPAGGKQSTPGGMSNFAATMARLKLAQQKRDEEKRKREAEAAAGGAETPVVSEEQAV